MSWRLAFFPARKIKTGDVIVFQQPGYGTLIRRHRAGNGQSFEVRTQIASTDSRNFGAVLRKRVHGKVIWHIRNHSDRKN